MSTTKEQILADINSMNLGVHGEIMLSVIEYIYKFNDVRQIGIGDVKEIVSNKFSESEVVLSLQKLCLLKNPILSVKYEIQIDEDLYYPLSKKVVNDAVNTNKLFIEEIGQFINFNEFKNKVFMYFQINRDKQ